MDGFRHHLVRLTVVVLLLGRLVPAQAAPTDPAVLPSSRIAVVGDMQRTGTIEFWRERNHDASARIMTMVVGERPQALFLLGDMVWWGSSDVEWDRFDTIMRPVYAAGVPVMPILGNHEYLGDTATGLQHVRRRFPTMKMDHDVRIIDSIAFVLLNTNLGSMTPDQARKQRQWFAYTLRRLDADPSVLHVVVCGHHPPFTNSRVTRPNRRMQQTFLPFFQWSDKTSIWFAGHAHSYERFDVEGKQYIVAGGGGAPRQDVRLEEEGARFDDQYDGPARRPLHYLMLERRGRALTCTMHPLDGVPTRYHRDVVTIRAVDQSTAAMANSSERMRATIFPLLITPGSPAPGWVPAPAK